MFGWSNFFKIYISLMNVDGKRTDDFFIDFIARIPPVSLSFAE